MRKAELTCYGCGDKGHIERECPNAAIDAGGKPGWCGICDERTRLHETETGMIRCQQCHPLRRQQLKQNRKCPLCKVTIVEWDNAPCGSHAIAGTARERLQGADK